MWNIAKRDLYKSGTYLSVTRRNIPRFACYNFCLINGLVRFQPRTENPRVGGSIPPLAILNEILTLARGLWVWNMASRVEYNVVI